MNSQFHVILSILFPIKAVGCRIQHEWYSTYASPWCSSWRFLPSNDTHAVFLLSGEIFIYKYK